jgi:cytosine/uracil/thiamine/allantoin permease
MTLTITKGRTKRAKEKRVRRAVLVYQAGIANVFAVESFNMADYGREARRLLQYDFRTCEAFARGLAVAGVLVASAHCNMAGDIARAQWSEDLDAAPFSEQFRPVFSGVTNA